MAMTLVSRRKRQHCGISCVAFFLYPPLSVLAVKSVGPDFFVNIFLSSAWPLIGKIHAIYVIFKPQILSAVSKVLPRMRKLTESKPEVVYVHHHHHHHHHHDDSSPELEDEGVLPPEYTGCESRYPNLTPLPSGINSVYGSK